MNRREVMTMTKKLTIKKRLVLGALCITLISAPAIQAQFLEDALRLDYGMLGSGARSLSMGTAFLPVSDDFSATFYNPAGLAQIREYEISAGLRHTGFRNNTSYLENTKKFTGSSTSLDNLGIVIPVPTIQGSLTFAIGYNRVNDFTQVSSFEGFNTNDSIIPDLYLSRREMSYYLYLSEEDGTTPFTGWLYQLGSQLESGSVNNWSFSGGIEAVPNFFLGTTLNLISGTYKQTFTFEEEDIYDIYSSFPNDLEYLYVEDTIDARLSGFNALFGGLYNALGILRIGATIRTPTRYSVDESYASRGLSRFTTPDEDGNNTYDDEFDGAIEYNVSSPWKFSTGAAVSMIGLTVSAALDYQDWTQLEFRNAPNSILAINRTIREELQPTTNIRLGAEYKFSLMPLALRGGYIYQPSPYRGAPSELDRQYLTAGVGFQIQDAINLDLAVVRGIWESDLFLYDYDIWNPNQGVWRAVTRVVNEDIVKNSVVFSFRYRF
jgi:hypothetical protein